MKFQEGINTFRIFDKPVLGNEFWTTTADGKKSPVRRKLGVPILDSEKERNDKGEIIEPKHFWAMKVWNYKEQSVQILEITQKTIIKSLISYIENPKWGNPNGYDISVTKKGNGKETEYFTDHDPKEEVPDEIKDQVNSVSVNLEALFTNEDPFKMESFDEFLEKAEAEKEAK